MDDCWAGIPKAIETNDFTIHLRHEPSLIGMDVLYTSIYEGHIDLKIVKDGVVLVSGKAKAKIPMTPKRLKEILGENPENSTFTEIRCCLPDGTLGVVGAPDGTAIKFTISSKKI